MDYFASLEHIKDNKNDRLTVMDRYKNVDMEKVGFRIKKDRNLLYSPQPKTRNIPVE